MLLPFQNRALAQRTNSNSNRKSCRIGPHVNVKRRTHPFASIYAPLHHPPPTALTNNAALTSSRCQSTRCGCAAPSLAEPNSSIVGPTIFQIKRRRYQARTTLSGRSYRQRQTRSPLSISRQQYSPTHLKIETPGFPCSIRQVLFSSFASWLDDTALHNMQSHGSKTTGWDARIPQSSVPGMMVGVTS